MALLISVGILLALGLWGYGCYFLTAARSRSQVKRSGSTRVKLPLVATRESPEATWSKLKAGQRCSTLLTAAMLLRRGHLEPPRGSKGRFIPS